MVRDEIKEIIKKALKIPEVLVEKPREKSHGDYFTNIAMVVKKDPQEIAKAIKSNIYETKVVSGFINFFLSKDYLVRHLEDKVKDIGKGKKINVEFISANPTGPLTLGNARGGFSGDVLSNVLEKAGYDVCREFYINDRGKQIEDFKKGVYKGEKRTVSQIQKENQKFITKGLKIKFDKWFSEKSLYDKGVNKVLDYLKKKKLTYEKEGALWFKSTKFGDDKDRVLIKSDGKEAYILSDIAYLRNKFERGFDRLIFFWGADHHGYIKRIEAAAQALGYDKKKIDFALMQLVSLSGARMSKRAGVYLTLEELIKEVGLDVARFFFLQRSAGSHLNFDLKLAKKKSQENPVYYVQYAYARICSILKKTKIKPGKIILEEKAELDLAKQLIRFSEIVEDTAKDYQVQRIPQYAVDLAESFHRFYQECQVIPAPYRTCSDMGSDDKKLTQARLGLILAVKNTLKNTLDLMGISAPEKM